MFRNLSNGAIGACCMIVGSLLLTSQDAITKWMTSSYHAGEILFYRGIFTFIPIIFLVIWTSDINLLQTRSFKSTLLRAVLGSAASVFVLLSFTYLPLATALVIIFLSPIMLTALSLPILVEQVGWRRWGGVFVGFCGVIFNNSNGAGRGMVLFFNTIIYSIACDNERYRY